MLGEELTSIEEAVERDDSGCNIDDRLSNIEEELDLPRPVELEGDCKQDQLEVIG